jgi:methionyl-tRNA formyltransferase
MDRKALNAEMRRIADESRCPLVLTSDDLKESPPLSVLRELELDLIILAWWPYILKEDLIRLPRVGCLNFHPSYLPYNRGKHYNYWSIVEERPFGVTIHWVDEEIDQGEIAFQSLIPKSWEDTGETLYFKAQKEMVRLFKENFHRIKAGDIPRKPQDLRLGSFHYAKELEEASRIDLEKEYNARHLLNLLRARTFPPNPGAWFLDRGVKYEVRVKITAVKGKSEHAK